MESRHSYLRWFAILALFCALILPVGSVSAHGGGDGTPTEEATEQPTEQSTETPTEEPTDIPTEEPTDVPTEVPTQELPNAASFNAGYTCNMASVSYEFYSPGNITVTRYNDDSGEVEGASTQSVSAGSDTISFSFAPTTATYVHYWLVFDSGTDEGELQAITESISCGAPTETPTEEPTETPTQVPTETPTEEPTDVPTETPTEEPTDVPTETPTPVIGTGFGCQLGQARVYVTADVSFLPAGSPVTFEWVWGGTLQATEVLAVDSQNGGQLESGQDVPNGLATVTITAEGGYSAVVDVDCTVPETPTEEPTQTPDTGEPPVVVTNPPAAGPNSTVVSFPNTGSGSRQGSSSALLMLSVALLGLMALAGAIRLFRPFRSR